MLGRSDHWHAGALLLLGSPIRQRMSNSFQSQAIQAPGLSTLSSGGVQTFVLKQLIQGAPLLQSRFVCASWHRHRRVRGGRHRLAGWAGSAHVAPLGCGLPQYYLPCALCPQGDTVMEKTSLSDVTRRTASGSTPLLCAPPSHLSKLPSLLQSPSTQMCGWKAVPPPAST